MTRAITTAALSLLVVFGLVNSDAPVTVRAAASACTQTGDDNRNFLAGTPAKDVLCALAGDDYAAGRGKSDVVKGGQGNDTLVGNGGPDVVRGQGGNDQLFANDRLSNDVVIGGPGRDRCYIDPGDTTRGCEHISTGPGPEAVRALTDATTGSIVLGEAVQACFAADPSCIWK